MAVSVGGGEKVPKGGHKTAAENKAENIFGVLYLLVIAVGGYFWFGTIASLGDESFSGIFGLAGSCYHTFSSVIGLGAEAEKSGQSFLFYTIFLFAIFGAIMVLVSRYKSNYVRSIRASAEAATPVEVYNKSGDSLMASGDYKGAIEEFTTVLEKQPRYPGAAYKLGRCHIALGDYATASGWFQKELQVRPGDFSAMSDAGYCDIRLGRFASAEKTLEKAVEIRQDSAQTYFWLGDARRLSGKYAEAYPAYQKAKELDRDVEGLDLSMGEDCLQLEKLDEAIVALRSSVSRNSGQDRAHYLLGLALARKGRYDEAIPEYNAAIGINPGEKTYRDMLEVAKTAFRDANAVPVQKEIIREIVKIPCKYCGMLVENTRDRCPGCGAPVK